MLSVARYALKSLLAHTRLRRWSFYRHSTTFRPSQMSFLLDCVNHTHGLRGVFLEIGCYEGATTIWLNLHLDDLCASPRYVAIDTFQGFVDRDVRHEVEVRGRGDHQGLYGVAFRDNRRAWVQKTLETNGVSRVELLEADAGTFDYGTLGPVAFALVDVDLYVPVATTLEQLWPLLIPGGIIVVDDCDASVREWDGALQAYSEFCRAQSLTEEIVERKLGLLRKPVA